MTRAERTLRCYPWQALGLAVALGTLTAGILVAVGALSPEHILLALWSAGCGVVLAGVLEVGVVQLGVRVFDAARCRRRSSVK